MRRICILLIFLTAPLMAGHTRPMCRPHGSFCVDIAGPATLSYLESALYTITIQNVSGQTFPEGAVQFKIWGDYVYSTLQSYNSRDWVSPITSFGAGDYFLTAHRWEPGKRTTVTVLVQGAPVAPWNDCPNIQYADRVEMLDVRLVQPYVDNWFFPIKFTFHQPEMGIRMAIEGKGIVGNNGWQTYRFTIENDSDYCFEESAHNHSFWAIGFSDRYNMYEYEVLSTTVPFDETALDEYTGEGLSQYDLSLCHLESAYFYLFYPHMFFTIPLQYLEPGQKESVVVRFHFTDHFLAQNGNDLPKVEVPLALFFINYNDDPDDDLPYLEVFKARGLVITGDALEEENGEITIGHTYHFSPRHPALRR